MDKDKTSRLGSPDSVPITYLVDARWERSSTKEAEMLVKMMTLFNNKHWWIFTSKSDQHTLQHSSLVADNKDAIENSWCEGIANWDGALSDPSINNVDTKKSLLNSYAQTYNSSLTDEDRHHIKEALAQLAGVK